MRNDAQPAPEPAGHGGSAIGRRGFLCGAAAAAAALLTGACRADPPLTFGSAGVEAPGRFRLPRAVAASGHGVAVLDKTGRLQVFEPDGTFRAMLRVGPQGARRGLPIGVDWTDDGLLVVADTHQSRVRTYALDGSTVSTFGAYGVERGEFLMPQRVLVRAGGGYVVTDHGLGATNRIQVFDAGGAETLTFGGPEEEGGGLARPRGVVELDDGRFVVADQRAGLVAWSAQGALLGPLPGQPTDPPSAYGLARGPDGTLYATDGDASHVLRVSPDFRRWERFGRHGRSAGEFAQPWDVARHGDHLFVADTGNHRIQRLDVRETPWTRL